MEHPETVEAAVAAALSIFDFCREHPADARLLALFGREELIGVSPTGPLTDELAELNRPVQQAVLGMAKRLYGNRTRRALDRTWPAVFDLVAQVHSLSSAGFEPGRARNRCLTSGGSVDSAAASL